MNMSFFINHELEYFCVNKRCEDIDKIVTFHINELTETRTKSIITPKCLKCNKQLKGGLRSKDLIYSYSYLLDTNYFENWEKEHKLRCNGPLKQTGIDDKGKPIWYCEICKKEVYGYNHRISE
jgi:hypothetical protein